MSARNISLGLGVFYLLIGVLGFVPTVTMASGMPGHGLLFGIFEVNPMHNVVHLVAGAVLVYAGMTPALTTALNRVMAVAFALLIPVSLLAPIAEGVAINLPDTLLHTASALIAGYVGFVAVNRVSRPRTATANAR
jgi:hypothetical protein